MYVRTNAHTRQTPTAELETAQTSAASTLEKAILEWPPACFQNLKLTATNTDRGTFLDLQAVATKAAQLQKAQTKVVRQSWM